MVTTGSAAREKIGKKPRKTAAHYARRKGKRREGRTEKAGDGLRAGPICPNKKKKGTSRGWRVLPLVGGALRYFRCIFF